MKDRFSLDSFHPMGESSSTRGKRTKKEKVARKLLKEMTPEELEKFLEKREREKGERKRRKLPEIAWATWEPQRSLHLSCYDPDYGYGPCKRGCGKQIRPFGGKVLWGWRIPPGVPATCDGNGRPLVEGCGCPRCNGRAGCPAWMQTPANSVGYFTIVPQRFHTTRQRVTIPVTHSLLEQLFREWCNSGEDLELHPQLVRIEQHHQLRLFPENDGSCRTCWYYGGALECPSCIAGVHYWVKTREGTLQWTLEAYPPRWDEEPPPKVVDPKVRERLNRKALEQLWAREAWGMKPDTEQKRFERYLAEERVRQTPPPPWVPGWIDSPRYWELQERRVRRV